METDPEFEKRTEQFFGLGFKLFKAQVDATYAKAQEGDAAGALLASTLALRTASILLTEREQG